MTRLFQTAKPILLDFLSTIAFAVVATVTHSLAPSVVAAVLVAIAQIGWQKVKGRPIDLMQWASLALVVVFGGALLTHDGRFVMIKPTIIYVAIGAVMLRPGWMERYAPEIARQHLPPGVLQRWGYVWAALMFATAAANLGLALNGDIKLWALFMGFAPVSSKFVLFGVQYALIRHNVRSRILRERVLASAESQAS